MKSKFFYIKVKAIIGGICFVALSVIGKFFPIADISNGYYTAVMIIGMLISLYYILAYVVYLDFKNNKKMPRKKGTKKGQKKGTGYFS